MSVRVWGRSLGGRYIGIIHTHHRRTMARSASPQELDSAAYNAGDHGETIHSQSLLRIETLRYIFFFWGGEGMFSGTLNAPKQRSSRSLLGDCVPSAHQ